MVKGRGEYQWGMVSVMLSTYMNANRKKGARPVKPEELNPFLDETAPARREERIELTPKESIEVLRKVFCHA